MNMNKNIQKHFRPSDIVWYWKLKDRNNIKFAEIKQFKEV